MDIIKNSDIRLGNFTSSQNYKLLSMGKRDMTDTEIAEWKKLNPKSKKTTIEHGFGTGALTYIFERNLERKLGRSLQEESNARALTWGGLMEGFLFENELGTDYKLTSAETLEHKTIKCWKGSPDLLKFDEGGTVVDEKCPLTLKSFCQLVQPLYDGLTGFEAINGMAYGYTRANGEKVEAHDDGEKYLFQLISNAIITNSKFAELIVFMPYRKQLDAIRKLAQQSNPDDDPYKYYWIGSGSDDKLPYLLENKYYKSLNIYRFEVPEDLKKKLTDRVLEAEPKLIQFA